MRTGEGYVIDWLSSTIHIIHDPFLFSNTFCLIKPEKEIDEVCDEYGKIYTLTSSVVVNDGSLMQHSQMR